MTAYEALRSAAAWFDVSGRGKIRVTGEDNARLLHAMSTNDVKNLAEGAGLYAFFLTDKGRIIADSYIYHRPDGFVLDTEPEAATILRDHLDRYIIADDATLEDETTTMAAIALEGLTSFETAAVLGWPVPTDAFGTLSWQKGFIARASVTGALGLRVFLPVTEKATLSIASGLPTYRKQRRRRCEWCVWSTARHALAKTSARAIWRKKRRWRTR